MSVAHAQQVTTSPNGAKLTAVPLQFDLNPLPKPWEAVKDILKKSAQSLVDAVAKIINEFSWFAFSVPAPGEATDPATWTSYKWNGSFHEQWWNSIWGVYWALSGLGTLGMAAIAVYHYSNRSTITGAPINHHEQTRQAIKYFCLLAFGWILLAAYLHGMNVLTMGIAPDGKAFLSTPAKISKLGLGILLGAILFYLDAALVLAGIIVIFLQWLLILFAYAMFPVAVIGRASGSSYARTASDMVIAILVGLPILKFFQVLILRIVFSLPMASSAGAIAALLVTAIGVAIGFLVLPIKGTESLLPETMIAAGGSLRSGSAGLGSSKDKQTAAAVQQQSTQVASQVRVGANSAAQRAQPKRSARNSTATQPSWKKSTKKPVPSDRSAAVPTTNDSERVSPTSPAGGSQSDTDGTPSVTVNTAVNTENTAVAQAEASASSKSNDSHTGTNRAHRSPHRRMSPRYRPSLYRPLRRAKRKVEKRRRNDND